MHSYTFLLEVYTWLYFLERQFGNLSNFKHSSYSPRHFSWRCIILAAFILVAQSCPTLCNPMDCSLPGSSVHGILQARILEWVAMPPHPPGDLPNLGIEPRSPTLQAVLYCLSHQGSPRILEWVAYPFSRGSSWPRDWTWVSCIAGRFFTV